MSFILTVHRLITFLTLFDAFEFFKDDLELGLVHLRSRYSYVIATHQRDMG